MDIKYWNKIYKSENSTPTNPSPFSIFLLNNLIKKESIQSILDLGCGNGRDSYFFSKHCNVVGVDLATKPEDGNNVTFYQQSMDSVTGKYDLIYMRFSLHSVPEEVEKNVLNYAQKNCRFLAIEARSTSDILSDGKKENIVETSYASKHYRRYINMSELKKKVENRGFNVVHVSESDTYAKYKDTSPVCVRLIAKIN